MSNLLNIFPFLLCQVGRAVRKSSISPLIKFAAQHGTKHRIRKIYSICILHVFHSSRFWLMCFKIQKEIINHCFGFRVLDHTLLAIHNISFIAKRHVGITENKFSLTNRSFINESNTLTGGIYFILSNRKDNIELEPPIACFHIDARLGYGYPVDAVFIQNILNFVEVWKVTEPSV